MEEKTVNERPARGRKEKPGFLSSEFAAGAGAAAAPFLVGVPPETAAKISGAVSAFYILARTALKIARLFKR